MKTLFSFFPIVLLSIQIGYAQEFYGTQASRLVKDAKFVKQNKVSQTFDFIEFQTGKSNLKSSYNLNPSLPDILGTPKGFEFKEVKKFRDRLGEMHVKQQQYFNGIPVDGKTYILHYKGAQLASANGIYSNTKSKEGSPAISYREAFQLAKSAVPSKAYAFETKPTINENLLGELVYLEKDSDLILCYKFDIYSYLPLERLYVYINASNGSIEKKIDRIHIADREGQAVGFYNDTITITTDSISGYFRLRESGRGGGIETYDLNREINYSSAIDFTDSDNFWDEASNFDNAAFDVHANTAATYDYFLNEHGRDSYDDSGTPLISYVHYDYNYVNAFWNGEYMTYGDGDGVSYFPLTTIDIVAHEIAHGVTEYSAGLVYSYESGALNESFSDIFGVCVDFYMNPSTANWEMAEQISSGGTPFRDMSNPNLYGDPDTYLGNYWHYGSSDNGGVHTNSGVQNFWFYLLVNGGSGTNDIGNSYSVAGIGMEKAAQIAYRNLNVYLSSNSQYSDARFYSIQSAIDLFGDCSDEVIAVTNAWYAVGVGSAYNNSVVADFYTLGYGCTVPYDISFTNISSNATTYHWDFGDGTNSTEENPVHTYTAEGIYTVQLIANGVAACNSSDTLVLDSIVIVDEMGGVIPAAWIPVTQYPGADGIYSVSFENISYISGGSSEGYEDLSCGAVASIIEGKTYPINITTYSGSISNVKVWIDLNNNGRFSATEIVYESNDSASYHDGDIIIPRGSIYDTILRMRIQSEIPAYTIHDTSSHPYAGQIEDYGIILSENTEKPLSLFSADYSVIRPGETVNFTDLSENIPDSWEWFLPGADINHTFDQHPQVVYDSAGSFDVTLITINSFGSDTLIFTDYISVVNEFNICSDDSSNVSNGKIYDSGGSAGGYGNSEYCSFLISPYCADSIILTIDFVDIESCCDRLRIYDGTDASGVLLGAVYGLSVPEQPFIAHSGNMFLDFQTDYSVTGNGFEATWISNQVGGGAAPVAGIVVSDSISAYNVEINFYDVSLPAANQWSWNFGDGTNSTLKNPVHAFHTAGNNEVTLIAKNCSGEDTTSILLAVQDPPVMSSSPDSVLANIFTGDTLVQEIIIGNTGLGDLVYSIKQKSLPKTKFVNTVFEPTVTTFTNPDNGISSHTEFEEFNGLLADLTGISIGKYGGGISYGSDLRSRGAHVHTNIVLTSSILDTLDILIIDDAISFLTNELDTVLAFIENGGSLILCGDDSESIEENNYLLRDYNVSLTYLGYNTATITEFAEHSITDSVFSVYSDLYGTSITNNNPEAVNLMQEAGTIHAVAIHSLASRILVLNNESDQFYLGSQDGRRFINQSIDWLALKSSSELLSLSNNVGLIEPGLSDTVQITLDAAGLFGGDYYSNIVIESNDPVNSSDTIGVRMSVTGVPLIAVNPEDSIIFDTVFVGVNCEQTIKITNSGTDILVIDSIYFSSPFYSIEYSDTILEAGKTLNNIITFNSLMPSFNGDTLFIVNNSADSIVQIKLFSSAILPPEMVVRPLVITDSLMSGDNAYHELTIDNSTGGSFLDYSVDIRYTEETLFRNKDNNDAGIIGETHILTSSPVNLCCLAVDPTTGIFYAQGYNRINYYSYDPSSDKWDTLAASPHYSNNGGAVYLSGKIVNSNTNSSNLYIYDIASDSWSEIYTNISSGNIATDGISVFIADMNSIYEVNINSGVITELSNASPVVFYPWGGLSYIEGKLYGHTGNGTRQFAVYDLATGTWAQLPDVPGGTVLGSTIDYHEEKYYCYGSYYGNSLYSYSIESNTWSTDTIYEFSINDGGLTYLNYSDKSGIYYIQGELGSGFSRLETEVSSWLEISPLSGRISAGALGVANVYLSTIDLFGGDYSADVIVKSNDPVNTQDTVEVILHVIGIPQLNVSDTSLTFNELFVHASDTLSLEISNTGTDTLFIDSLITSLEEFSIIQNVEEILPDESEIIQIVFSPLLEGNYTDSLVIWTNDTGGQMKVTLNGIAILAPIINVNPSSLSFEVSEGESDTDNLIIENIEGGSNLIYTIHTGNIESINVSEEFIGSNDVSGFIGKQENQIEHNTVSYQSETTQTKVNNFSSHTSLDDILLVLEEQHTNITDNISGKYNFSGGETGYSISDGGNDMYDGGNYINTAYQSNVQYSNKNIIPSSAFGFKGQYFTAKYDGLFILAADIDTLNNFTITGNLGADGSGNVQGFEIELNRGGKTYYGYGKKVYGTSDPSVNHLIIVPSEGSSLSQTFSSNTNNDYHSVDGLINEKRIYYLLFAGTSGANYSEQVFIDVMNTFLDLVGTSSWVKVEGSPSGVVLPGYSSTRKVNINSEGMEAGSYEAIIRLESNDPLHPVTDVPVSLTIVPNPNLTYSHTGIDFGTVSLDSSVTEIFTIENIGDKNEWIYQIRTDNENYEVSLGQDSIVLSNGLYGLKKLPSGILIDGKIDTQWYSVKENLVSYLLQGSVYSAGDIGGKWRSAWDEDNLYVLCEVTDDIKISDSYDPWNDDCIEVFLDADNSKGSTYDNINDFQFFFRWGDPMARGKMDYAINEYPEIEFDMSPTTSGYILECAIPWEVIGIVPDASSYIGFEVQINDDDNLGMRDTKISWYDKEDISYYNPSAFSSLNLSDQRSLSIPVTFEPVITGDISGKLIIESSDLAQTNVEIPLIGEAYVTEPEIIVTPLQIHDTVNSGDVRVHKLTVSNENGGTDLFFEHFSYSPWVEVLYSSGIVATGQSTEMAVQFDASVLEAGTHIDTLFIASNDTDKPVVEVLIELNVKESISNNITHINTNAFGIYPNPFTFSTSVSFTLEEQTNVGFTLYNSLGMEVLSINEATYGAGESIIELDRLADLSSGIYYLQMIKNSSERVGLYLIKE
jgi:Zn-dependent metalloprotease